MSKPDYYRSTEDILFDLGITKPEEIDLEMIAHHCGVSIGYEPLSSCEACLIGHGDKANIIINSNSHPSRKRFSIAHELGHWMNDRSTSKFNCSETSLAFEWSAFNTESRANIYASELLMPKSLIHSFINKRQPSFELVVEIANAFNTSITSAAIRVIKLSQYNSMLLLNSPKKRDWFIRSRPLEEMSVKIWPQENPGMDTNAFSLLNNSSKSLTSTTVTADNWISNEGSCEYEIVEDSIISYQGKVLTFLTWEDESQLIDLESEGEEPDDSFSPRFKR